MITEDEIDLRDDDREPEAPEPEEEQPLDLDAVATRLGRVSAARDLLPLIESLPAETVDALRELIGSDVLGLIAEAERLRERLAVVATMPTEHRYVVLSKVCDDPDDPLTEEVSAEAAIREATSWPGGRALRRTVHLGPWQDLADFSTEPPF